MPRPFTRSRSRPAKAGGAARLVVIGHDDNVDAAANVPFERWGGVPLASADYENAKTLAARIDCFRLSAGEDPMSDKEK